MTAQTGGPLPAAGAARPSSSSTTQVTHSMLGATGATGRHRRAGAGLSPLWLRALPPRPPTVLRHLCPRRRDAPPRQRPTSLSRGQFLRGNGLPQNRPGFKQNTEHERKCRLSAERAGTARSAWERVRVAAGWLARRRHVCPRPRWREEPQRLLHPARPVSGLAALRRACHGSVCGESRAAPANAVQVLGFFLKYLIESFSYSWLLFCFVSGVFFVRVRAPFPWLCSRSPARCSRFSPAAAGRVLDGRGPGRPGDRTAAAPARGTSSPAVSGAVPAGAEGRDGAGRPRLRQRGPAAAGAAGRPSPLERHQPGGQGAGWAKAANPPARGER